MALDPRDLNHQGDLPAAERLAPLAGTRTERMQRLQIGLFGLGMMVLLVGLANIIMETAAETRDSVSTEVPVAAGAGEDVAPGSDPLADAGVVPDIADGAGTTQEEADSGEALPLPSAQPAIIPPPAEQD